MSPRVEQIDYYLTPLSPWVHLAGTRPAEVAARHGVALTYKPLDTSALFARTGGKVLGERHPSRQAYRLQELRRRPALRGVPLNPKPRYFPTNPAPASYAIIAAQAEGGGDVGALVHHLSGACWERDEDIADDAVIREALTFAGFDPDLADRGLWTGADIYARNLEQAALAGVFGVPFFVCGTECFWGEDRLDDLDHWLAGRL